MEPEISPEKMRCVVVRPDLVVPGCICVPAGDLLGEISEDDTRIEKLASKLYVSEESGQESGEESGEEDGKSFEGGRRMSEKYKRGKKGKLGGSSKDDRGYEGDKEGEEEDVQGEEEQEQKEGMYRSIWKMYEQRGEDYFTQMSDRTREEGEVFEDYMRFFIEEPCVQVLSSISSSEISCIEPSLQRTIAIVKPEAMIYKDVILRAIFEAGFQITGRRVIHLTPEQVSEIYAKCYGSPSFPHLVISVSSGPVLVMALAALNATSKWKQMIGPDGSVKEEWFFPISMRKRFGLKKSMPNSLHGSENIKESNRENRYFYPESVLEPLIIENPQITDFCNLKINPILLKGLTEVVKKKPLDPILFLADWLLMNNPFQPRMPYKIALTPT